MAAILETERLLLKPHTDERAEGIYEVVRKREIADAMLMIPHPYPRKQVDGWLAYLQKSFEIGSAYEYAVFAKQDPTRYIGNCGLVSLSRTHQSGEIGYFIEPSEWGKGYATEACRKLVEAGMTFEGRFKQEFRMDNRYEDIYLAIPASEYAGPATAE